LSFFTFPFGIASFTDAIMVSTNLAFLYRCNYGIHQPCPFPFKGCMHITFFALGLSTTLRTVLICMKVLCCCKSAAGHSGHDQKEE
jgi:hypothetical protein